MTDDASKPSCTVYVIESGRGGPIKVGIARNVANRIKNMQTANPERLAVVATMRTSTRSEALALESRIHRIGKRHSIHGEWFYRDVLKAIRHTSLRHELTWRADVEPAVMPTNPKRRKKPKSVEKLPSTSPIVIAAVERARARAEEAYARRAKQDREAVELMILSEARRAIG